MEGTASVFSVWIRFVGRVLVVSPVSCRVATGFPGWRTETVGSDSSVQPINEIGQLGYRGADMGANITRSFWGTGGLGSRWVHRSGLGDVRWGLEERRCGMKNMVNALNRKGKVAKCGVHDGD